MAHLLDVMFRFPPDKNADREFVERALNLLRLPVLVVDAKSRPQLTNLQYTDVIIKYTSKLSGQTRRKNLKAFSALVRPHVAGCLRTGEAQLLPGLELPGQRDVFYDVVVCPGQIQGSDLAFVVGLPAHSIAESGKDGVANLIFDGFEAAAIFLDRSLRYRNLNRRFLEAFGLGLEEALGKKISEINPSEQAKVLEKQINYGISNRQSMYEETFPITTARRGVLHTSVMAWPVFDRGGEGHGGIVIIKPPAVSGSTVGLDERWQQVLGRTVDALGPPSFFTHLDGGVLFMTSAGKSLIGAASGTGHVNLKNDIAWADPTVIQRLYDDMSRGSDFRAVLVDLETPAGLKPFRILAFGIKDLGDIVSQVFLVFHDVTETESFQRLMGDAAKSLAQEKEILEKVVDNLDMPYAVMDSDLIVRRMNTALARRLKISTEAGIGKRVDEIIPSTRQTGAVEYIRTAMEQGTEIHVPRFEHVTKDGVLTPMTAHFSPIRFEGKPACMVIVNELVEKERLENQAARWEKIYEAVFSKTQDGVVVVDRNGLVLDMNPVIASQLGGKEKWIGRNATELIMVREDDMLMDFWQRALSSKKPIDSGCLQLTRKETNESVFAQISYLPLIGRDGGSDGMVTVAHFTTGVKKLEEQVREYTENLQRLVDDKTRDLSSANAALEQSVQKISAVASDLRRERDRSECLRRIAVRVAGGSSVGEALRMVAEELSKVVPADRFLWAVRSQGDEVWLSEIYTRSAAPSKDARHFNVPDMVHLHSALSFGKGLSRAFCERSAYPAVKDGDRAAGEGLGRSCPFVEEPRRGAMQKKLRELMENGGLVPAGNGAFAVAPVMLSEGSWGLICAHSAGETHFSADDTCFMCLAASTVGYVWQAADAASALRRLEAAGETVGELAHDLKYPLNRIMEHLEAVGYCDISSLGEGSALDSIKAEVERLTMLAQELMEVSNPGHREPQIIDLKEAVDYCIALTSSDLAPRSITVKSEVDAAAPAFADRRDVTKILLNMLANSVDAVGENGSITVSARTGESKSGIKLVGLVVEDSGSGVPESEMEKIFEAFYTTKKEGCGLGLFSAKKRAKANGGDMVCEMGDGGKSRFVAMFPIATA